MKIYVSGSEAESGLITFSETDFGRKKQQGGERFTVTASVEDFTCRFEPLYARCIAELIRDDEITGEFHPPFSGAARYPELDEFLGMAQHQRMEMIDTYFVFDILRLYIGEDLSDADVKWSVSSLDSLSLEDGILSLSGRLVKKTQSHEYPE
ncbi:hypothetical protein [Pseudoduganella lutea]|uniref:Uncharacterized protein n=1 Tax=Pseudoduganella lutea TaxID=321985 RepID=A0A4P6L2J6_9BURK|nr:hypothetical protein [Pseudoduganella lutea]QBE65068.1 hypothetical protein EWM63_20445 [Pseudoduganella lutea]